MPLAARDLDALPLACLNQGNDGEWVARRVPVELVEPTGFDLNVTADE